MTIIGEMRLSTGRRGVFRIYTAADGTKGGLTFAEFRTVNDAQRQVSDWLKLTRKITSKEPEKDEIGRLIGDRIVAKSKSAKSGRREFMIIRRVDTKCFLIESQCWTVATQVEELTR